MLETKCVKENHFNYDAGEQKKKKKENGFSSVVSFAVSWWTVCPWHELRPNKPIILGK